MIEHVRSHFRIIRLHFTYIHILIMMSIGLRLGQHFKHTICFLSVKTTYPFMGLQAVTDIVVMDYLVLISINPRADQENTHLRIMFLTF